MAEEAPDHESSDEAATSGPPTQNRVTRDPGSGDVPVTLTTWTLSTMNTVVLVVGLVLGVHATGALGDLLAGLNTVVGVAVFLLLWGLFVLSVRWVLSDASLASSSLTTLTLRGVVAGGAAGICFLLVVLAAAVVPLVVSGSITPRAVLLVGAIGTGVAAIVGAVFGLVAALLDAGTYRLAGRFV